LSIFEAIINGIVQGLTEFLPISSSGHLSLIQYFTGRGEEAGMLFTVLLHLGTLLAVFLAFWKTIADLVIEFFRMLGDLFRGKFSLKNPNPKRRMVFLLVVSLIPMAISFFLLDFFDKVSTDNDIIVEGVSFLVTSVLLFACSKCVKGHKNAANMLYRDAMIIGVAQAVAPMPGVSRSGSTTATGLLLGLSREYAVAFSFIMGVPTVLGANVLELADAIQTGAGPAVFAPVIAAGVVAALIFGLLAIKMVRWLVASDKFIYFAWYTLILGLATILVGIIENLNGHALQSLIVEMMK
jgi:undecaprenyl-diphosphatase